MSTLVKFLNGRFGHSTNPTWKPVTLHSAQGTSFAVPTTIGGGGDVTDWIDNQGYGPDLAAVTLLGSTAATITGPVALYAERRSILYFVGLLNYGLDITLVGAQVGWSGVIAGVAGAERLVIGGVAADALINAGTVKAMAFPIATKEEVLS